MNDDRLIAVGRMLASLPRPMNAKQVRAFAEKAVDYSPDASLESLAGILLPELTKRGASLDQIEQVARAVLEVEQSGMSLTRARTIIGSVWAGIIIKGADR